MVTWLELKRRTDAIARAGTLDALKHADALLVAENREHGAARCKGQIITKDYLPTFSFCGRYECWKCGDTRRWHDVERAAVGMAALPASPHWSFVTLRYSDTHRTTNTDADMKQFRQGIAKIISAWSQFARDNGHTLYYVVFYGFKSDSAASPHQLHAHVIASFVPQAVLSHLRERYEVFTSQWLENAANRVEMKCHIERVASTFHVASYIGVNIDTTLFRIPKSFRRVVFSASWLSLSDALDMVEHVATCRNCGQYALVFDGQLPNRCTCCGERSTWSQVVRWRAPKVAAIPAHYSYTHENSKKSDIYAEKQCYVCHEDKPLTEFHNGQSECRECRRKRDHTLHRQCQLKTANANHKSRTRHGHNAESMKAVDVEHRYNAVDGKCEYCDKELDTYTWQVDHFLPMALNGQNSIDNVRIACHACNASKSDKTPLVWLAELAARGIRCKDTPHDMPIQVELFNLDNIDT